MLTALAIALVVGSALQAQEAEMAQEAESSRFAYVGDWKLRGEHTDLPERDIDRWRGHFRPGFEFLASDTLEFGAAARLSLGSDDNSDNRVNLDNQRSDEVALDRLWMRWQGSPDWVVVLGKDEVPLSLSPMLWDEDLRPVGVSSDWRISVGDFDSFAVVAGYFAPDFIYEDDSRLAAIQTAYRFRDGAPWGGAVLLSYLHFSDLDELPSERLSRTNRVSSGQLLSDYELLDLQLVGRGEMVGWPVELQIDLVKNLGADDLDEGGRVSLVVGNRRRAGQWEFGVAAQRMQRDAVLAAASDDDWWFHSFARGGMGWLGYGFSDVWNLRVAGFEERRDGTEKHVRRYLLDLQARW